MKKVLMGVVLIAVAAAGGAYVVAPILEATVSDEAVGLVPQDAIVYASVFVEPSNDQKRGLRDLLQHFDEFESFDDVKDRIAEFLNEEALSEADLDFERDVEPWLGRQVAFFMSGEFTGEEVPEIGVLMAVDDEGAAEAAIGKFKKSMDIDTEPKSYKEVDYEVDEVEEVALGIVEGFLVGGTESGFKAVVDARESRSLAELPRFEKMVETVEPDHVAFSYFDFERFFEHVSEVSPPPPVTEQFFEGYEIQTASVAYAQADAVILESVSPDLEAGLLALSVLPSGGDEPMSALPATAWGAFSLPDVGLLIEQLLEGFEKGLGQDIRGQFKAETGFDLDDDVLAWMEGARLFVQGRSILSLGGALLLESTDRDKSARFVDRIEQLLRSEGAPTRSVERGDYEGFSIVVPGVPEPLYLLAGDDVLLAYGEDATQGALGRTRKLADNPGYSEAVDALPDFQPTFYIEVPMLVDVVEAAAALSGEPMGGEQEWRDFVEPLSFAVAGTRKEGNLVVQRFVLGAE